MRPPVLELFVVWHPSDSDGERDANRIIEHFRGSIYTGLIGGTFETYIRSAGWRDGEAPRPLPWPGRPDPTGLPPPHLVAVVPLLGLGMARAVADREGPWHRYLADIVAAHRRDRQRVALLPVVLRARAVQPGTALGELFDDVLDVRDGIDPGGPDADEPVNELRCRYLAQAIAQFVSGDVGRQIRVFISHTKATAEARALLEMTDDVLARLTRLDSFLDRRDLQTGDAWKQALRTEAQQCAMLVLRTDRYPLSPWCQEEIRLAKRAGVAIVVIDGSGYESRGCSFMDNLPKVSAELTEHGWRRADVRRAVNVLVDECLKRTLWRRQWEHFLESPALPIHWWAPHAPESLTFIDWSRREHVTGPGLVRILHPDPPMADPERDELNQVAAYGGVRGGIEAMTPLQLAARGGDPGATVEPLPSHALAGVRLGVSTSVSADLARLGLAEVHFRLALGELARGVLAAGGTLAYGGHLKPDGYTAFLASEVMDAGREGSLLVCLAWHVHHELDRAELEKSEDNLGSFGRIVLLDLDGHEIDLADRPAKGQKITNREIRRRSLRAMRRYMSRWIHGWFLIGGRSRRGGLPGVLEEALIGLDAGQPLYLAGGFGGVTADIARAFRLGYEPWPKGSFDPGAYGPEYAAGYQRLVTHAASRPGLSNGLTAEENQHLAVSHRPADIAALATLGIGRFIQGRPTP